MIEDSKITETQSSFSNDDLTPVSKEGRPRPVDSQQVCSEATDAEGDTETTDVKGDTEATEAIEAAKEESDCRGDGQTEESHPDQNRVPQSDLNTSGKEPDIEQKAEMRNQPTRLSNEAVTEHTASLWKYLPIPTEEPEPAPEYLNCAVKFPGSIITAARVRGKKHKHEGSNCDDWFEVANFERITFVAVSDGAGSKKYSRIGARVSCKAAIGFLVQSFEELLSKSPEIRENIKLELSNPECMAACRGMASLVQQSVVKAYEAVEAAFFSRSTDTAYAKAVGRKITFKDFSGTLLLAAIIPIEQETKEHLVISCQIGDGMIFVMNTKGSFSTSLRLLGVPDSGDFSGETDFLTSSQMKSPEALQKRTKLYRGVVDTVMVMSDGVADDYFPNETEMRRLYYDLIVNRIINSGRPKLDLSTLSKEDLRLFKKLPDPQTYPWVNDQSVKVSLQYTKKILGATKTTLEALWDNPKVLDLAMIEVDDLEKTDDPSERLKIWLDNYVERGSFDDRTLVVVQM